MTNKDHFGAILGHDRIKLYFETALFENSIPQTLLFSGPDGVGKKLFAQTVAESLLGKKGSLDLHLLKPEGKSGLYSIDALREMIDRAYSPPFEAGGKVFILEEAERMLPPSANALLKTLEEPQLDTTFILLSSHSEKILPTILSRAALFKFGPLPEEAVAKWLEGKGYPPSLAKLAHGSLGRACEMGEHPEFGEERKLLFSLLSEHCLYPETASRLLQIEKLFEEAKEEDPISTGRRIESLLNALFMWHRDQHLREIGGREDLLFFPDQPSSKPKDLALVEELIEEARLGIERNIKLSVCLERCLRV